MPRAPSVVTTCSTTDGTGPGSVSGSDERMPSRNGISPWHQPLSVGGGCSRSLPGARATTSPRTGSCPASGPAGVVRWTSREPARTAVTASRSRSNPAATTRGRLGGLERTGRRHAWPSTVWVIGPRNRDVVARSPPSRAAWPTGGGRRGASRSSIDWVSSQHVTTTRCSRNSHSPGATTPPTTVGPPKGAPTSRGRARGGGRHRKRVRDCAPRPPADDLTRESAHDGDRTGLQRLLYATLDTASTAGPILVSAGYGLGRLMGHHQPDGSGRQPGRRLG